MCFDFIYNSEKFLTVRRIERTMIINVLYIGIHVNQVKVKQFMTPYRILCGW